MYARGLRLALLLVASLGVPASASAATRVSPSPVTRVRPSRGAPGAVTDMTGLAPAEVTTVQLCPPAPAGVARCEGEALVFAGSSRAGDSLGEHSLVRPRVAHRSGAVTVVARGRARGASAAGIVASAPPQAGTPAYLQQAYDLSYLSQTGGTGDTVAVVDAFDDPAAESDLATYRSMYGLGACTTANGCFKKVNESGASAPLPATVGGWESEISLDLDAVSAVCPHCKIVLVEASSASWSDLETAIAQAATLGAEQISNSWALGSKSLPSGAVTFPGVATVAAAGDQGYVGAGVSNYPAALANVTAAGGTSLVQAADGQTPRGFTETAWSVDSSGAAAGSGCDLRVAKPSYQIDVGCTGRSYSDVSADADPTTGLIVFDGGHGGWAVIGGTSLSSPLIAAYYAVSGIKATTPQWAYASSSLLGDPLSGSNGNCLTTVWYICNAGTGYDGPTGTGSISGDVATGAPGIGGPSDASGTYATAVGLQSATLQGGVYPNGLDTSYWWQYGTDTSYGQQTAPIDLGAGRTVVAVTSNLAGLSSATTYHYRLVAQNGLGTSYGYDYTMSTAAQPGSITGGGQPGGGSAGAPSVVGAPRIVGTARRRVSLTVVAGSWRPAPDTYAYQWQRTVGGGFVNIRGARAPSYTPVKLDERRYLRVIVTARNAYGAASAASRRVGPVAADPPVLARVPVLTGEARSGGWLQYRRLVWRATTSDTRIRVQWQRCRRDRTDCRTIAGASASRYRLTVADAGHRVLVTVIAANPDGTVMARSRPTAVVAAGGVHRAGDLAGALLP